MRGADVNDMSGENGKKNHVAVEIQGTIKRLRTMADGSIDLTINLPEYCMPQAGVMLSWINELVGGVLEVKRKDDKGNYGGRLK